MNLPNEIDGVKIEPIKCSGTAYSVCCPHCGKFKVLSSELNTMTAVCNRCGQAFKIVADVFPPQDQEKIAICLYVVGS